MVVMSPRGVAVDVLSDANLQFLEATSWEDLSRCPYTTLCPSDSVGDIYRACQDKVLELYTGGSEDAAWRLHYFILRVLFCPSTSADPDPSQLSLNKLQKQRCHAFLRGEWAELWTNQKRARPMGTTAARDGALPLAERARVNQSRRAGKLAKAGEFSKAMDVLDGGPMCDMDDETVIQILRDLHNPGTDVGGDPLDALLQSPPDFNTGDYAYVLHPVKPILIRMTQESPWPSTYSPSSRKVWPKVWQLIGLSTISTLTGNSWTSCSTKLPMDIPQKAPARC